MSAVEAKEATQEAVETATDARCLDCRAQVDGKFCSACGQEVKSMVLPVDALLKDVVEEFLKLDSRVLATVRPLVFRPGFLTNEYLAGRRTRYLPPFKLYFFIAGVWFLLFALTGMDRQLLRETVRAPGPPVDAANAAMDRAAGQALEWSLANSSAIAFLMVPVAALLLKLLYLRSGRLYIEHLTFVVHLAAFGFLSGLIDFLPLPADLTDALALGALAIYGYLAMRRVYGEGPWRTLGKAVSLALGYLAAMLLVLLGAMVAFALRQ